MKIEFIPSSKETELTVEPPQPAKNFVPKWYSSIPRFSPSNKPEISNGEVKNNSLKSCVPFFDAMTNGYIQKTWCDIYINVNENSFIDYSYSRGPQIIDHRQNNAIEIPDNFYPVEFIWKMHWVPKLPKGWSALIVSPLNRIDLPFQSLSGIIDSDSFYHIIPGNYPFYISNKFVGIIPKGTPMYQIIPVKRESWHSNTLDFSEEYLLKLSSIRNSYFFSAYKRFFHHKKIFK